MKQYQIVNKKVLTPEISQISVYAPLVAAKAKPGQFIILRVSEEGERIPLTISSAKDGLVTVIYQKIGGTTLALDQLNQDDCLQDFVGPLGVPTHVEDLGRVAVLGGTGKNFAAGMSGGIAYVLDEGNDLYKRLNKEMVSSGEITSKYDVLELKEMIEEHVKLTNSEKGKQVLAHFSEYLPKFKKIVPHDYKRMMMAIVQMEEKGLNAEQAQIEAFYANAGR